MIGLDRFQGYHAGTLRKDLIAGLIVGIVAIPLGMAFAIASGVRPEYGLYTVIISGFLISLLGGSKYQIGGPTGAFVPVLFGVVMQYGYENLLIAGVMAGVLLLLLGFLKLGSLIQYIPRPVTIGFTAGIAVIIFSGQIASFLGLRGVKKHEAFHENMIELGARIFTVNPFSVVTALICLSILLLTTRYLPKVPGALAGLIVSSVIAIVFFSGRVDTIGSVYGAIPGHLPALQIPGITWEKLVMLLPAALVIAMLGGIESLLSALVADRMAGSRHNSNRELIGQGIANIITPFFGGIPATGAIARTATNIKNGGASPVSGMVHAITVLLVLLLFANHASHIPLASLAPILMFVAWNMSERKEFKQVLQTKSSDAAVLIVTFLLTVFTDLTTAVGIGLVLAAILFIKKMGRVLTVKKALPDPEDKFVKPAAAVAGKACPQFSIYTMDGPLFFGSTQVFEKAMAETLDLRPNLLLLRMGKVSYLDTSGEAALDNVFHRLQKQGGMLLITGIQGQSKQVLETSGLYKHISEEHIFKRTSKAIDYALRHVNEDQCRGCRQFTFNECAQLSKSPAIVEKVGKEKLSFQT